MLVSVTTDNRRLITDTADEMVALLSDELEVIQAVSPSLKRARNVPQSLATFSRTPDLTPVCYATSAAKPKAPPSAILRMRTAPYVGHRRLAWSYSSLKLNQALRENPLLCSPVGLPAYGYH